eukprot:322638-Chlamydomonas_euryale.AAC.1
MPSRAAARARRALSGARSCRRGVAARPSGSGGTRLATQCPSGLGTPRRGELQGAGPHQSGGQGPGVAGRAADQS